MTYLNQALYKKVYMLEFRQASKDKEVFCFSVPPQSEEFVYPQRISETKTFGGIVFEDYGNDSIKINLSGSTINQELKRIYTNGGGDAQLNGQDEIFLLAETVKTWGSVDKLKNKSIVLTNLMTGATWNVLINELQIKRSKDNPMAYNYSISFTGISESNKNIVKQEILEAEEIPSQLSVAPEETVLSTADRIKGFCRSVQNKLDKGLEQLKSGLNTYSSWYKTAHGAINAISGEINKLDKIASNYIKTLNGFIDATTNGFLLETLGYTEDLVETAYRFIFDNGNKLYSQAVKTSQDIIKFAKQCHRDFVDENIFNPNTISPNLLDQYKTTTDQVIDTWTAFFADMEDSANENIAIVKNELMETYVANPGSGNNDDTVIKVYGYKTKILNDNDTWDSIAVDYYGNAQYAPLLQMYNNTIERNIEAGSTINLPIFDKNTTNTNNKIYNVSGEKDNYGKDILINDGEISIINGDIGITESVQTVTQAILNRLSTEIDSRIRISLYGIKSGIGEADVALNFLKNSVEKTILADPRVSNIESIKVIGYGDNVQLDVVYTDINDLEQSFGGIF